MTSPLQTATPRDIALLGYAVADTARGWNLQVVTQLPPAPASLPAEPLRGGDAFSDWVLAAAAQLLAPLQPEERHALGLVLGTQFGSLEVDRDFQKTRLADAGRFISPAAFTRTLPSSVPAEISLRLAVRGPMLVVTAGEASATLAVARATAWMEACGLQHCLAGGWDRLGTAWRLELCLLGRGPGLARVETRWHPEGVPGDLGEVLRERRQEWLSAAGLGIRVEWHP